jgi:hypothetical protein
MGGSPGWWYQVKYYLGWTVSSELFRLCPEGYCV